jgi:hypothetical protein
MVTAMVMPLSLKLQVGFSPSNLKRSLILHVEGLDERGVALEERGDVLVPYLGQKIPELPYDSAPQTFPTQFHLYSPLS